MRNMTLLLSAALLAAIPVFAQTGETESLYRPTVAFVPFENLNEEEGDTIPLPPGGIPLPPGTGTTFDVNGPMPWLDNGIPEMMYFMLQRTYTVNTLNISDIRTAVKKYDNSDLAYDTPISTVTAASFSKGVDYIIGGSFDKREKDISINAEVFNNAGESLGTRTVSGKIEDIFKLEEEVSKAILSVLGIEYGDTIITRDPTSSLEAYKYFSLGTAKYYTGERLAQFQLGLNIDPNFVELILKSAEANRLEGAAEFAKQDYEKARSLNDVYPEAPTELGSLVKKTDPENPDLELTYAEEALMMDPYYVKAMEDVTQYYYGKNDFAKSIEYCNKRIEVQPNNKMGYYDLGNSLWQSGLKSPQWEKILKDAVKQYDKAIGIDPAFAEAYYNRGSLYSVFKDAPAMISDFKNYLRNRRNASNKIDVLVTIYKNGGDCEDLKIEGVIAQEDIDQAKALLSNK